MARSAERYRRQDEIGTPWGVTVDGQTLADGTVTLRDRDSLEQTRVADRGARRGARRAPGGAVAEPEAGLTGTARTMDTGTVEARASGNGGERLAALAAVALAAAGFFLLLAAPDLDVRWEHHPSHFWLVVVAAATTAILAYTTGEAADRRGDTRLFWVSNCFLAAGGFLALHALATPGVLLDSPNLGFQIATPVGLAVASVFAAISALPVATHVSARARHRVRAGLIALMIGWGVVSIAGLAPLDRVTEVERASGPITVLGVLGALLFVLAAIRYLGLARERRSLLPLAVATSFFLLAEAILATAFARSWHVTWWEWHLLILAAFALVAWAARREWREERFVALYTEETARGQRELSVLFADLAGFTSFSEGRDPRAVSEVLNAYFEVAIPPVVSEHGGVIDQLIGDAILATFSELPGEPDHPLRAARAALAIRDRTEALAAEHPDWPRFRLGVNTGEAMVGVVGAGGGRSYTVIGDAVNTAARLENAAPVGGIAIGDATMRRLPGARVANLGGLEMKGKAEPVQAFLLEAALISRLNGAESRRGLRPPPPRPLATAHPLGARVRRTDRSDRVRRPRPRGRPRAGRRRGSPRRRSSARSSSRPPRRRPGSRRSRRRRSRCG